MYTNTKPKYSCKLPIPFGQLQETIDWCETNCTDEWNFSTDVPLADRPPFDYIFQFASEQDYVAFSIWRT